MLERERERERELHLCHSFRGTMWQLCLHKTNTIFLMWNSLCSIYFLKHVHVQNVHLLSQYTPNNDVEQSDIPSGLLLMEYHWWHVQNSMNTGFLDMNLTGKLPQWILWGSCKNLHDCISTLVISETSLSSVQTFQHVLHRSIDFKLVSDSCYFYPC